MNAIDRLRTEKKVLLYGQEDYVARLSNYLDVIFPTLEKECISFPLEVDKPDATEFDFSSFEDKLCNAEKKLVVITFSSKFNPMAAKYLTRFGFSDFIYYDALLDNSLKKSFFASYFNKLGKSFTLLEDIPMSNTAQTKCVHVYQAKSVHDKDLNEKPSLSKFILPIQVGAALTEKKIASLRDEVGENISDRNRRYSEMTAFYWMWKNDKVADYLGICHYRRIWCDLDQIVEKLKRSNVDVVLPLPTLCEKSIYDDYMIKHIPTVYKPMMEVLKEKSPEYYEASQAIFKERIFYASNMCILKREVLNDLCDWMFPIVMEVERRVGDIEDTYYNRYAGFCTERLITLYFLYNCNDWGIAHAEKIFLS